MRHVTWAMTWMLVGLAITLATASVIEHSAMIRIAQQQTPAAAPGVTVPATTKGKTGEPARSLVVAWRRHEVSE